MERFQQFLKAILIALVFLVGLFAVTVLFPAAGVFGQYTAEKIRGNIAVYWYGLLARVLNLKIRRFGAPLSSTGLIVANHVSWLDIVALGTVAPFDFIAKREVAEWPVIGYLGRRVGTLFLRRGDLESSRRTSEEMVWRLRRGHRLVLFPEGTSSSGKQVLRFHARLFQPALLAHTPVQAVAIAYRNQASDSAPFVGNDDFLPHLWRLLALSSIEVDLSFHAPVAPGRLDRNAVAGHTRNQITAALERSSPASRRAG